MAMNRAQFAKMLEPGLNTLFGLELSGVSCKAIILHVAVLFDIVPFKLNPDLPVTVDPAPATTSAHSPMLA